MEMSEEEIKDLIEKLSDENYDVRKNVADVLVKLGVQSVTSLIASLNHPKPEIRMQSAFILGEIGDKRAVDSLVIALSHGNPDFRREVSLALNKIVDKNQGG